MFCKICQDEYRVLKTCRICYTTACYGCVDYSACCFEKGVIDRFIEDNANHPEYCIDCGSAKKHIEGHLGVLKAFGIDCDREIERYTKMLGLLK